MILEKSQNKMSFNEFKGTSYYFGIAIQPIYQPSFSPLDENPKSSFMDIECFFLAATYHLSTSRVAEGFLCWLLRFGHLLSPSKIRRLIQDGQIFDPAILGGLIEFLHENNIKSNQWKIVTPFCKKRKEVTQLLEGPAPRIPSSYFIKYRIAAPLFRIEMDKFLLPTSAVYKNCLELSNRALFGSVVNADVVSYLEKHPGSTPYQIAKRTHHHKARVFEIYADVLAAS